MHGAFVSSIQASNSGYLETDSLCRCALRTPWTPMFYFNSFLKSAVRAQVTFCVGFHHQDAHQSGEAALWKKTPPAPPKKEKKKGWIPPVSAAAAALEVEIVFSKTTFQANLGLPGRKTGPVLRGELQLGFPPRCILITSVSRSFHGARWEECCALKSCFIISCGKRP